MKRIISVLLALVMMLSLTASFAQEQPQDIFTTLLAQSNNPDAVYDVVATINLDTQTVSQLVAMFASMGGEEASPEAMEQMMQMINLALAAVNKTRLEGRQGYTDAVGAVKTDDGVLLSFATSVDTQEGLINVTTDLLPGVYFQVSEEMLKQDQTVINQKMAETASKLEGLGTVIEQSWQEKVVGSLTQETGDYTVNGQNYTARLSGELNAQVLAPFFKAAVEAVKQDEQLKEGTYELIVQSAEMSGESLEGFPQSADEFFDMMLQGLEGFEQNELLFGKVNVYPIGEKEALIELTTPYSDGSAFNLLLLTGTENITVDFYMTTFVGDGEQTAPEGELPEVNFDELRQNADQGMISAMDVRVKANIVSKADQLLVDLSAMVTGMPVGASVEVNLDGQTIRQSIGLSVMTGTTLVSLSQVTTPSTEQIEKLDLTGLQKVVIDTENPEELNTFFDSEEGAALVQGAIQLLMERIPVAYPQEGETILTLLQQTMSDPSVVIPS